MSYYEPGMGAALVAECSRMNGMEFRGGTGLLAKQLRDTCVAADELAVLAADLAFRLDAYQIAESLAASRIMDCHRAIVKFCDWAEDMLPMPVHPAIAGLMIIGRQLKKEST